MDSANFNELIAALLSIVPQINETFLRPIEQKSLGNLTPTQVRAIRILESKELLSMTQFSTEMDISKQQMTKIINALVEKGYVERVEDKTNRRLVLIRLTKFGRVQIKKLTQQAVELLRLQFKQISEEDKAALIEATQTIKSIVEKIMPGKG
ncbi:MAG: Multiple antibiotic resistance protein MarR [Eubacteriales bacterium]|jgi:DNA-binding MarR family transcriptional regulator